MTKIEPTSLDIAKATLLAPFGLDELATQNVFGTILAHRADDADLYFQYNRSEGWTLEEGQVKSGSFSIDQGVGVRVVAGEKTAFAYSDEINADALLAAARVTRAIAADGGDARIPAPAVRSGAAAERGVISARQNFEFTDRIDRRFDSKCVELGIDVVDAIE